MVAVTRKMAIACLIHMAAEEGHPFFCLECGIELTPEDRIEMDHRQATIHSGPHDYKNIRPIHYDCHKRKTGRDVAANNKIKRIRGERKPRPKRPIPSRPFQKRKVA